MDLNISNRAVVTIFGIEIWITETIVNTWFIMAILIAFAIVVRIHIRKAELVPRGLQNAVEMAIEMFDDFVVGTVGEKLSYLSPWYFTVFVFLAVSTLIGVFGVRAPSADWATTFGLSLITFFLLTILSIRYGGLKGYIEPLLLPAWPFLPMNIIGELAKPISLSFRLFGNMLSATIINTMYSALTPWWASIGVPVFLHLAFDIFFGLLQVYIFVIISLSYVNSAVNG